MGRIGENKLEKEVRNFEDINKKINPAIIIGFVVGGSMVAGALIYAVCKIAQYIVGRGYQNLPFYLH